MWVKQGMIVRMSIFLTKIAVLYLINLKKHCFTPNLCAKGGQVAYAYANMYRFGDNLKMKFEV